MMGRPSPGPWKSYGLGKNDPLLWPQKFRRVNSYNLTIHIYIPIGSQCANGKDTTG